jgi:hypothetical protein
MAPERTTEDPDGDQPMHGDVDPRPFDQRVERRHEPRRAADMDRATNEWARMIIVHRGKVIAGAFAVGSAFSSLVTTAGWRLFGPPQELAAFVEKQRVVDSAFVVRITRLEIARAEDRTLLEETARKAGIANYLICWTSEQARPGARVPGCREILAKGLP